MINSKKEIKFKKERKTEIDIAITIPVKLFVNKKWFDLGSMPKNYRETGIRSWQIASTAIDVQETVNNLK